MQSYGRQYSGIVGRDVSPDEPDTEDALRLVLIEDSLCTPSQLVLLPVLTIALASDSGRMDRAS